ncbi:three-Cys-motif partner protein TcmP [Pedobacter ginsengisoli]|uniref:three-Cys-motif partner protein TcmP n=1 Tax=Pedobacter ginsengisoli TaxID=363852 RepID=UPI002550479F|nr:three-Cys-motif partner protein TcmP [Pedobacter ginsengisoli]
MAKKIDSQKVMLDHSLIKVKLLGRYLDKYLNIIANDGYTEKITILDLFCGEGIYENGGKGSPVIILENVKKLLHINSGKIAKMPQINIVLNDIKQEKIEKVKSIVAVKDLHVRGSGDLKFTNLDYKDLMPKLISFAKKLKNEKAFVFIDPYGYKEIRATEIKSILETKKTEVLLFLPTQFMYRFDDSGTPESLIDLLDDLVVYENWERNDSVIQFIDQFKEGFKKHLGPEYFVDTFTILKDKKTMFCLFFFSSHIRGFEKMLEAKWDIDREEGRGWTYEQSGNLFSAFKTNPLEGGLLKYLVEKPRNNIEIYNFTLHKGFLPKHVNEVLTQLQVDQKIDVNLPDGIKARKGAFYISYDHYKSKESKVLITLK